MAILRLAGDFTDEAPGNVLATRPIVLLLLIGIGSVMPESVLSATCSCAGTPLMGALDTSATEQGDLFLSFTSEFHEISDLVEGSSQIDDETDRRRSSVSQALAINYGLSDRWGLSALVSYIEHEREVGQSFFGRQKTSGLGDSVIMLRYTPRYITPFSRQQVSLGLGARLPTGKDNAGSLIRFSEDMQPSTGAAGAILWASHSYAFNQAATRVLTSSVFYTNNEKENDRDYVFGDQLVATADFSQNFTNGLSYSIGLRYQHTTEDQRFDFDVPNTGGQWLDFTPSISYAFDNGLDVGLSGRVPLKRKLNGVLQFTTSYAYALSFTFGF